MNAPRTQIMVTPGGDAGSGKLACAACPATLPITDMEHFHKETAAKFLLVAGFGWLCSDCYMRTAQPRS